MAKKVYFACSIRGGGDTTNYEAIIKAIKVAGVEVLSEVFVHDAIHLGGSPLPEPEIFLRDTTMIQSADAVVAEVTNPSLGVGYELAYAEHLQKPVLCLFDNTSGRNLSAMIKGNPYFSIIEYSQEVSLQDAITAFIER